jgi:putative ATP-binding cassette transporter
MLLKLIYKAVGEKRELLLLAGVLTGLGNASAIATLTAAAHSADHSSPQLFAGFLAALITYLICFRYSTRILSTVIESIVARMRIRLADRVRSCELEALESVGFSDLYERITRETVTISNATWAIANGIEAGGTIVFMGLYLAYLSTAGFWLAVLFWGVGLIYHHAHAKKIEQTAQRADALQGDLFNAMMALIKGFKEARLHTKRNQELFLSFKGKAIALERISVKRSLDNQESLVFFLLNLFALLAALVFVMPQILPEQAQSLGKVTAGVIFLLGPTMALLFALPQYEVADMALRSLGDLDERLTQMSPPPPRLAPNPWQGRFQRLQATDLQYRYPASGDQDAFSVGPLSLSLQAGQILFIVGGNGSGKSTLVKLLTGLYKPSGGRLEVDGVPIGPDNVQAYREMISAVFTDFHLFEELYGLESTPDADVARLLQQMQLADKTSLESRRFSTLNLSTGQRKRLAMVVALLEDRAIYVFDEWAADQDPEFRHYYYKELLPELKRRGKTVIAISHDDRYFHCADQVITMELGQIRERVDESRA